MSARQIAAVVGDLHLLTVLAETRSFTQTARHLGISKASVSMRIKDLERAVGLSLVRRTTRSITLTQAGQQLVEDTRGSFARIEQSFTGARDLMGEPRGLVRVSAPVALGRQVIAPSLPGFLRQFPEIRLELDLSDRFVNLVQEGYDLVVRHATAIPDSYVATVLCESKALLVASPDYLRRRGIPASPPDLARHECLLYLRDGGAPSWSFVRSLARGRVEEVSVPVSGSFKANNSEVLRTAAMEGLGIALLPDFSAVAGSREGVNQRVPPPRAAADVAEPGSMVRVLPDWKPVGFFGERLYALRPWAPRAPRAAQCLIKHLSEVFAGGF